MKAIFTKSRRDERKAVWDLETLFLEHLILYQSPRLMLRLLQQAVADLAAGLASRTPSLSAIAATATAAAPATTTATAACGSRRPE